MRGAGQLLGAPQGVPAGLPGLLRSERAAAVPAEQDERSLPAAGHCTTVSRALLHVPQDDKCYDVQLVHCMVVFDSILAGGSVQALLNVCSIYIPLESFILFVETGAHNNSQTSVGRNFVQLNKSIALSDRRRGLIKMMILGQCSQDQPLYISLHHLVLRFRYTKRIKSRSRFSGCFGLVWSQISTC